MTRSNPGPPQQGSSNFICRARTLKGIGPRSQDPPSQTREPECSEVETPWEPQQKLDGLPASKWEFSKKKTSGQTPVPHLPAELLDRVVNPLHHSENALEDCYFVAGSWTPLVRDHIFANVRFYNTRRLQSRENTSPDPSALLARCIKTPFVNCSLVTTTVGSGWIWSFLV